MIVEASLSQEAERESLSTSLALEQAGASINLLVKTWSKKASQLQSQK